MCSGSMPFMSLGVGSRVDVCVVLCRGIVAVQLAPLRQRVVELCAQRHLVVGAAWMEKLLQLYQIQHLRHGVMMVGPSGSGKSTAWRVLLDAMSVIDGVKGESYVIDPKAMTKDQLYGTLGEFVPCCAVLCCAVLCCAVLCCAVLCCAVLCCAVDLGCAVLVAVTAPAV